LSQGTLQEPDHIDIDIKSNEVHTVHAAIHQAQGTHLMDVDASVNADIDMNGFYSVCTYALYCFSDFNSIQENMESRDAMQIDADSGQMDID
jgi:hypothetical protein